MKAKLLSVDYDALPSLHSTSISYYVSALSSLGQFPILKPLLGLSLFLLLITTLIQVL